MRAGDAPKRSPYEAALAQLGEYPVWTCGYSNEEFDRASRLAGELTRIVHPGRVGYTKEAVAVAERVVRDASAYGEVQQAKNAARRTAR